MMNNTSNNTLLGEKIKELRRARGLTQAALAGDKVTRNMLSSIENGTANPSLDTLFYIADGLGVSVAYLLSGERDLSFYEKRERISNIYRAYEAKNYTACINLINLVSEGDNELFYLLASCYLELGKRAIANGSLLTAEKHLRAAEAYTAKTKINTWHIQAQIPLYMSIAKNVQSPLLEFDANRYISALSESVDFEFFKYLMLDFSYAFENPVFSLHIEGKALIKDNNYTEAVKLLLNAAELAKSKDYHAFVVFGIYTDLEYCYKQLYDFEKAYLYSTKRMTLIEGFKS